MTPIRKKVSHEVGERRKNFRHEGFETCVKKRELLHVLAGGGEECAFFKHTLC
jgi:hypothetical protein